MKTVRISHPGGPLTGHIKISGSKSLSNRALILSALSGRSLPLTNLSTSKDTTTLQRLLASDEVVLDAGHAGTTFRFMTAYLVLQPGTQTLTGSDRMQQRPIGPLVEALRDLGAPIRYLGKEGYPPLEIGALTTQTGRRISIRSDISSQFLSALSMIGPCLPEGLVMEMVGEAVSRPYLDMTLRLMETWGVTSVVEEGAIRIDPQAYVPASLTVESDWSSASYYYALAAMAPGSEIRLSHFSDKSLQADAHMQQLTQHLGVTSLLDDGVLTLRHEGRRQSGSSMAMDFIDCPDIAQTMAVAGAAVGMQMHFTGLKTLKIKETDRVAALKRELSKVGVHLSEGEPQDTYIQTGRAQIDMPVFSTYEDHRMAMALAPLGYLSPVTIENPRVVDKSYPDFWEDLITLGFRLEFA